MSGSSIDELRKQLAAAVAKPATTTSGPAAADGDSLEQLRESHEQLARKVAELEERTNLAMNGLLENLKGLQLQAFESQIQQVTSVINAVQATAYGDRGGILTTNNLLLAGNQLFWIMLDPLLRQLGLTRDSEPSAAVVLTPAGTLVTGHLLLGNRQHVRFISGVTRLRPGQDVSFETLRNRIGADLWPEFQSRSDIPVQARVLAPPDALVMSASVRDGVLRIVVEKGGNQSARVAWLIDTGATVG